MLSRRKPLYKYFIFWSLICGVSAAPSFWIAFGGGFNPYAMLLGIFLFILSYAFINASLFYEYTMQRNGFLRRALTYAFGLRMFVSAIPVINMLPLLHGSWIAPFYADIFSGIASLNFIGMMVRRPEYTEFRTDFFPTLFTTLTQGFLLSLAILLVALLIWGVLTLHYKIKQRRVGASI